MGKKKYVAYVGTYVHGSSKGLNVYDVDVETPPDGEKRSGSQQLFYVSVSKNLKYLYSIEDEGVAVFRRDANGDLERLNSVNIEGMRGCFLSTDYTGKYLFVAVTMTEK